jgi:hypothetical protein
MLGFSICIRYIQIYNTKVTADCIVIAFLRLWFGEAVINSPGSHRSYKVVRNSPGNHGFPTSSLRYVSDGHHGMDISICNRTNRLTRQNSSTNVSGLAFGLS